MKKSWPDSVAAIRPPRLREGSVVAVATPSWGGPHVYTKVYERGLEVLREDLGLEVREMEHARAPQTYLRRNPQCRARDLNEAFLDPGVDAVIASVGGDDSIRALPYLRVDEIVRHPKVLMGFSDTTTILTYLNLRGMVTFHSPSVMAGFAQMRNYPQQLRHVREMLFDPKSRYEYRPFGAFSEGYPDWALEENVGKVNRRRRSRGWRSLQGEKAAEGELFGGCIEVLELMKRTRFFPPFEFWKGKVLFLETSEQVPSPDRVLRMLRGYGMTGVLGELAALLVGRPRGYSRERRGELERGIKEVMAEYDRPDLPVLADVDFGHTDPQFILPLGGTVRVDPTAPSITLLSPAVE